MKNHSEQVAKCEQIQGLLQALYLLITILIDVFH